MTNSKASQVSAEGNWDEQKRKLKARFTNLLDADLNFEEDKKEEMLNKLQIELGTTKEELLKIITVL